MCCLIAVRLKDNTLPELTVVVTSVVFEGRSEVHGSKGHTKLIFTLHLRRLPLYYVVNLIVPCCLLSLVTLTTFLLPPDVTQRSTIGTYV